MLCIFYLHKTCKWGTLGGRTECPLNSKQFHSCISASITCVCLRYAVWLAHCSEYFLPDLPVQTTCISSVMLCSSRSPWVVWSYRYSYHISFWHCSFSIDIDGSLLCASVFEFLCLLQHSVVSIDCFLPGDGWSESFSSFRIWLCCRILYCISVQTNKDIGWFLFSSRQLAVCYIT